MTNIDLSSFGDDLNIAIIGASGGIGASFVKQLAEHKKVKSIYTFSRAPLVFEEEHIYWSSVDYTDTDSIERAADQVSRRGAIDIVIVATGLLHESIFKPEKSINDIDSEYFNKIFDINTMGPALIMKYFLPHMNSNRKSVFAALSARVGSISDNQLGGWYAYRASKAALNMLLKTASIEMARKNEHTAIIGLHPGTVDTNLSKPFQSFVKDEDLFSPETSTTHLLNVINKINSDDTGKIFAWDGQEIEP